MPFSINYIGNEKMCRKKSNETRSDIYIKIIVIDLNFKMYKRQTTPTRLNQSGMLFCVLLDKQYISP